MALASEILRWTWPITLWGGLATAGIGAALVRLRQATLNDRRARLLQHIRRSEPWTLPSGAGLSRDDERAIRACLPLLSATELLALKRRFPTGALGRAITREVDRWVYGDRD